MFSDYAICGINTAVQVAGAGTYWRATVFTDIEADSNWEIVPPIMRWDVDYWDSGKAWGP